MNKNNIKVGAYVWWKRIGNSSGQNINCPGVISKVSKTGFNVITFDDMLETEGEILFDSDTQKEFRIITEKEATAFHQKRTSKLRDSMVEFRKKAQEAEKSLKNYTHKTQDLVRTTSELKLPQVFLIH